MRYQIRDPPNILKVFRTKGISTFRHDPLWGNHVISLMVGDRRWIWSWRFVPDVRWIIDFDMEMIGGET